MSFAAEWDLAFCQLLVGVQIERPCEEEVKSMVYWKMPNCTLPV